VLDVAGVPLRSLALKQPQPADVARHLRTRVVSAVPATPFRRGFIVEVDCESIIVCLTAETGTLRAFRPQSVTACASPDHSSQNRAENQSMIFCQLSRISSAQVRGAEREAA
jgi:hypothetical protein